MIGGRKRTEYYKTGQLRNKWPKFLYVSDLIGSKQFSPHPHEIWVSTLKYEISFLYLSLLQFMINSGSAVTWLTWNDFALLHAAPGLGQWTGANDCVSSLWKDQIAELLQTTYSLLLFLIRSFHFFFVVFFLRGGKGVSLKLGGNGWILMESNWLPWLSQRSCGHKS